MPSILTNHRRADKINTMTTRRELALAVEVRVSTEHGRKILFDGHDVDDDGDEPI